MNKKLLAVAITGALGAAVALPASADIKITGKFYPAYVDRSGGEANDGSATQAADLITGSAGGEADATRIDAFNSNIRISGEIDAGGGLTGFFQCETDLDFDRGGTRTGTWCDRNSAMGIKGGFGRVFLGAWDTPLKQLHFPTNMFGISSGSPLSNSNLLSRTPYDNDAGESSFHVRQPNMVQYWSPDLGGFQVKAMWGTEEDNDQGPPRVEPENTSISLTYTQGPLEVGIAFEEHQDFLGGIQELGGALTSGVTNSTDEGISVAAVYKLGKTTEIGVEWESLSYQSDNGDPGNLKEYERDAWRFGIEHKIDKWILALSYGMADEGDCKFFGGAPCSTKDLGATQLSFGGMYNFTKALGVYAWYTKIDNDDSAAYSFLDDTPPGADPTAIAIGLYGRF